MAEGTTLAVQPGGSITFKVPGTVNVLGDLIAPAGTVSIAYDGSGFSPDAERQSWSGPHAVISVAGQWINDGSLGADTVGG